MSQLMEAEAASPQRGEVAPALIVRNLTTEIVLPEGTSRAVNSLSFQINAGETLCIVGESGSGKSVTALSIMQLISSPPMRKGGGEVILAGRDLLALTQKE